MSQPIDIRPEHLATVQKILGDILPRDTKVWVFGSRAKWTTKKSSDLDIAIDAGRTLTRKEESLLTDLFEESDLPYKVDMVDIKSVSESFKRIIENDKVNLEVFLEDEWRIYFLEETGRIVTGKTPSTAEKENFGGNTPFITPSDMNEDKFISKTERYLTERGLEKVKSSILPNNSVLVSCIGTVGNVAINVFPSVTNQQLNSIVVNENFDADFIYYSLKPRKSEIQALASSGSVQPIINKRHFSRLTLMAPPLPEQKAIAAILGALDDKIEANRKMNATLEGMARALFKSWFVDFDPVRAKAEGRPSGLPADLDALFPASFTDSPLGEIPMGWEVLSIGELGKVITGKTPSTSNTENFGSEYPFVTIPDLDGRMFINSTARYLSKQGAKAIQSSLIPENAVMMSCIATVGRCGITVEKSFTNQQINTLVCNQSKAMPSFMYWMFRNITNEVFNSGGGGSVYTNVSKSRFSYIKVICPSVKIQEIFCQAWFEKLKNNNLQNQTIATLRDTLLPKLISGQIRVGDAENIMEKAL